MKISIVSGGFDPIHSGHIKYFEAAKEKSDFLIVALNSDSWLTKKKGKPFMCFKERRNIIQSLKVVDKVIDFEDDDVGSATNAILKVKSLYPDDEITFCNGGDRDKSNITEMKISGVKFAFGVGGDDKINSSSTIIDKWFKNTESRVWGNFSTLYQERDIKLKELIIDPGKGMSLQRHFHRDEIWFISEGACKVNFGQDDSNNLNTFTLNKHDTFAVKRNEWHQIFNPFDAKCKIVEIQYGESTDENDIERKNFYEGNDDK